MICSVDELNQNCKFELYKDNDDDDEECQKVISPTFQAAMNCTKILRTCFVCHNTSKKSFQNHNSLNKPLIEIHLQSSHQTFAKFFFLCKHL